MIHLIQLRLVVQKTSKPPQTFLFVYLYYTKEWYASMGGWNRFMIVRMDWFDSFMIGALSAVSPGKQRWTQPFWGAPTYGWSSHRPYIISNSDDHRNTLSGENAISYPHILCLHAFISTIWMILTHQPQMVLIIAATNCLHKILLPPYHPPHIILIKSYLLE